LIGSRLGDPPWRVVLEYARDDREGVFRLTLPLAEEAATDVA
jgi:hypothetical protein